MGLLLAFLPTTTGIWIMASFVGTGAGVGALVLRSGPKGEEAIQLAQAATDSWKSNYEALRVERDALQVEVEKTRQDAQRRFDEREAEKDRAHALEVELATEKAKPSTLELANAISEMARGFEQHRGDLIGVQREILASLQSNQEAIGSMQQALVVLVDRNRHNRSTDQEGGAS